MPSGLTEPVICEMTCDPSPSGQSGARLSRFGHRAKSGYACGSHRRGYQPVRDHSGTKPSRDAIAAKYLRTYGFNADPEREITVFLWRCQGMIAALLATVNPDDEIIILFDPFYENYGPDIRLCMV
jgi:aspartate/methionine/tyrosine aminotransferase